MFDNSTINKLFALLNEERELGIHELMVKDGTSHFDAMVKWDSTHAPRTTDRKKFSLIGCEFPPCFVPKDEAAAELCVNELLSAYSMWNEVVKMPDEWNFRQCVKALQKIMDDEVPLIAPKPEEHYCIIDLTQ